MCDFDDETMKKLKNIFELSLILHDSINFCWNEGMHGYYQLALSNIITKNLPNSSKILMMNMLILFYRKIKNKKTSRRVGTLCLSHPTYCILLLKAKQMRRISFEVLNQVQNDRPECIYQTKRYQKY